MATYTYTGRLTDMGEAPFADARPRLTVAPERPAFTPAGVGVDRTKEIGVGYDGAFMFDLIASADLNPPTRYVLRCDWLTLGANGQEILAGWSEWRFTAAIGGGPINTMPDQAITRVWFSTSPPPVDRAGITWINPVTGDVREWSA